MLSKDSLLGGFDEEVGRFEKFLGDVLVVVAILLSVVLFVKAFWLKPYRIEGTSMLHTLDSGDWVLADEFAKPSVGDVVIIYNSKKKINIVKRVIGVPGDTVYYDENGVVYDRVVEDGEETFVKKDEPYAYYYKPYTPKQIQIKTLKSDEIFVLGDNRLNSMDSRYYGAFKLSDFKGVVHEFVIENRKNLKWLYPYI